ncbi:MAG: sulfatase-like hydrolase/transferase [Verrucomicrobiota bacterium]
MKKDSWFISRNTRPPLGEARPTPVFLLTALAVAMVLPWSARAAKINIAMHQRTDRYRDQMDPLVAPATPGMFVDTGVERWNNFSKQGSVSWITTYGLTFSDIGLFLADGSACGASISCSAGAGGTTAAALATKDSVAFKAWYGFQDADFLTISNLPPTFASAGYDVVVYGDADVTSRDMDYTIGGTTLRIEDRGTFSGTLSEGGNYVVFSNLTASTFTLTGNTGAADYSTINALVIESYHHGEEPVIELFSASDHYVSTGTTVTLSWQVAGATSVSIDQGIGSVASTGSVPVVANATEDYVLVASNHAGVATASMRVGVGPPRPNILMFLVDDMGWQHTSEPFYYDSMGDPVTTPLNDRYRTPNMETLADRGMKFTDAYAMPVCSPSRVCLMTGKNSARHHVTQWTTSTGVDGSKTQIATHNSPLDWLVRGLPASEITLPSLLADAGYRTIHAGKGHFGSTTYARDPSNIGFDINIAGRETGSPGSYSGDYGQYTGDNGVPGLEEYHNTGTHLTEALTLEMNGAISNAVADDVPFFAYLSHYAVHGPFQEDPRFSSNYPTLSGNELYFATMIEGMDKSLGDILAQLDALGVAEDTLVVFMSDNGGVNYDKNTIPDDEINTPLRDQKGSAYEGGIRVPMIAAWANPDDLNDFQIASPVATNAVEDDIVTIFDLYPTLLEAAGVAFGHSVDGTTLLPYFAQTPGTHRTQDLLVHFPHDHEGGDYFTVYREGPWKLIYQYHLDSYELYNLSDDIGETNDLASVETNRVMAMSREMARQLDEAGAQWPVFSADSSEDPLATPMTPGVDIDADGIMDNDEDVNGNGLVDPGETDADDEDTDDDRTPDGAELRLGLDPLDSGSAFTIQYQVWSEHFLLSWPSLSGLTFDIEQLDASNDWQVVEADIPATSSPGTSTLWATPTLEDSMVVRVRLN